MQACRGVEHDEGVDVTDAEVSNKPKTVVYRLPKEADFVYAYSTAPGSGFFALILQFYWLTSCFAESLYAV